MSCVNTSNIYNYGLNAGGNCGNFGYNDYSACYPSMVNPTNGDCDLANCTWGNNGAGYVGRGNCGYNGCTLKGCYGEPVAPLYGYRKCWSNNTAPNNCGCSTQLRC